MSYNFYDFLINTSGEELDDMPAFDIKKRNTDKKIIYNKNSNRLDRIAGDVYEDESLWRLIMWANPEYDYEFDIPDGTVIRIPFPKQSVIQEVSQKIKTNKNIG